MKSRKSTLIIILTVVAFVVLVVLAISSGSWPSPTWISQVFAVLAGACITVVITELLLQNQSDEEEHKERKLSMFRTNLEIYQGFSKLLWGSLEDGELSSDEMARLRQFFLENLSAQLPDASIKAVAAKFEEVSNKMIEDSQGENDADDKGQGLDKQQYVEEKSIAKYVISFTQISNLIRDGLKLNEENSTQKKDDNKTPAMLSFYNSIQKLFEHETEEKIKKEDEKEEVAAAQEQSSVSSITKFSDYYGVSANSKFKPLLDNYKGPHSDRRPHFFILNAWDLAKQKEHTNILCLVEYGQEKWRTDYVRGWIFEGDIVFLYARGGYGYIGAFKAVNYKDSGSPALIYDVEHIPQPGKPKDKPFYYTKEEAAAWDIYNAISDGATRVTAVNVEPIYFYKNGVGNPIAVRRRTLQPMYNKADVTAVMQAFDKKLLQP